MIYQRFLSGLFLGAAASIDLKCRKVYIQLAAGYFLLALSGHLLHREQGIIFYLTGILPGLFYLTVSWISREGLGYGDSLMVLICGLSLGFSRTVILVSAAFFFAALLSIFLLSLGKADRKTQLPFLPFLFLADMLWEILFWLGSGAL